MGLFKALMRALGLSNEARVKISAPGIEVELTGDPDRVSALLGVIKSELEKSPRRSARRAGRRRVAAKSATSSKVVQPTELDEMDSPYALPEAVVVPVADEETTTDERRAHPRPTIVPAPEATTLEPDAKRPAFDDGNLEQTIGFDDEGPDDEATAVTTNPSGQVSMARRLPEPTVDQGSS